MSDLARCPKCGGESRKIRFTWWGGFLGPLLLRHAKCPGCDITYNGRTGESNETKVLVYIGVSVFAVLLVVGPLFAIGPDHVLENLEEWWQEQKWSRREDLSFVKGPVVIGTSAGRECVVGLAKIGDRLFAAGVSSRKNEDRFRVGPLQTSDPQAIHFATDGGSYVGILTPEHQFTVVSCNENRVYFSGEFPKATRLCSNVNDGTFGIEENGVTRFVRYDGTSPQFFGSIELSCPPGEFDPADRIPNWIPNELKGYQVLAKLGSSVAFATLYADPGTPGKYALTFRKSLSRAWYDIVVKPKGKAEARTPLMALSSEQIAVSYEEAPNLTHVALYDCESSGDRVWDVVLPAMTPPAPVWKLLIGEANVYLLRGGRMDILRIGNGGQVGAVGDGAG